MDRRLQMKNWLLPPVYFNILIPLAILLHYIMPIKRIIQPPANTIGLLLIVIGLGLNVWSSQILRESKTSIAYQDASDHLVLEGPFRFSRNPIYLSGIILLFGIALLLGSLITFVFPTVLLLILEWLYIPIEERMLEDTFGSSYLDYKTRVRRWI